MDSELSTLWSSRDSADIGKLQELILRNDMEGWLEADIDTLKSILGDKFLDNENTLVIKKENLLAIEEMLLRLLSPDQCRLLLPEVRKLRLKPIKDVLKGLPVYAQSLADRMGKLLNPIEIQAEAILIDPDRYQDFTKALIHVFRNIIDHGLETQEERLLAGKTEYCNIRCAINLENNLINLSISDDGRGFDFNRIRQIIADRELLSRELACSLSDDAAVRFMIDNHISTKDNISYTSGRGLGLSAIKGETERLGGTMTIAAERSKGTQFLFRLPYNTSPELPEAL